MTQTWQSPLPVPPRPRPAKTGLWVLIGLVVLLGVVLAMRAPSDTGANTTSYDKTFCQEYANEYSKKTGAPAQEVYDQCRAEQDYRNGLPNGPIDTSR